MSESATNLKERILEFFVGSGEDLTFGQVARHFSSEDPSQLMKDFWGLVDDNHILMNENKTFRQGKK
jgi:hypothetical protein